VRKTVLALAAALAFTGAGLAFAAAPATAANREFSVDNRDYSTLAAFDSHHSVDGGGATTNSEKICW
jgi:hypothetical protein